MNKKNALLLTVAAATLVVVYLIYRNTKPAAPIMPPLTEEQGPDANIPEND
jgi:hypothetical protein